MVKELKLALPNLDILMTRLGYSFQNLEVLEQAMTHKSYRPTPQAVHNERLEFLGDAVLDLALAQLLIEHFPNDTEGALSKKRASLVNESHLGQLARELDLRQWLRLGPSEERNRDSLNSRLLSSTLESLIGAICTDGGYGAAYQFVAQLFTKSLAESAQELDFERDYKTRLQELTQKQFREIPEYRVVSETGPSHLKVFQVEVRVQGQVVGAAEASSKKNAEQAAAQIALEHYLRATPNLSDAKGSEEVP